MKRLVKGSDKFGFGVCSGIANYCDIDPLIVRVLFIIFCSALWIPYIVLAILMPNE